MTVLESFADWTSAQQNSWSDLAIERACHAIADTVGSMIAGGREKVVQEIVAGLYRSSEGRAKNVGNDLISEPSIAACINASAAHLLELDDNYYPALTHASAVSVPALLALAQEYEANGSAVVDAYIVGLELQAAIARGVNRSHYLAGWHGTGTIACIGTAGACARIMGLDRAGIVNAMSIATSMALPYW
ncbi:MAG: MmgE/PrpD family protein, partial [Pseudomonadota bacterium]